MVEELYKIFTHVDVLKSREPDYFICEKPIAIDLKEDFSEAEKDANTNKSSMMDSREEDTAQLTQCDEGMGVQTRTFVTILEEGCRKYYAGSPPVFKLELTEMNDSFVVKCELYGTSTWGRGRTKKTAKQLAAKEMLERLIEKDLFKDFGIGSTKEEAWANLEALMTDSQKAGEIDGFVTENWVGKVIEKCHKLKLQSAIYNISEQGPSNQRLFIATCKIGDVEVAARGKTKKIAKTLAAQQMYIKLENWKTLGGDTENTLFAATECEVGDEAKFPESISKIGPNENLLDTSVEGVKHSESLNKIQAAFQSGFGGQGFADRLNTLIKLGDKNIGKIFLNQDIKFVSLKPNIDGDIQCLLSIDGPGGMKNVFYGFGATETEAKDYAARNALVHLELFVRTSEPIKDSNDELGELSLKDGSLMTNTKEG